MDTAWTNLPYLLLSVERKVLDAFCLFHACARDVSLVESEGVATIGGPQASTLAQLWVNL